RSRRGQCGLQGGPCPLDVVLRLADALQHDREIGRLCPRSLERIRQRKQGPFQRRRRRQRRQRRVERRIRRRLDRLHWRQRLCDEQQRDHGLRNVLEAWAGVKTPAHRRVLRAREEIPIAAIPSGVTQRTSELTGVPLARAISTVTRTSRCVSVCSTIPRLVADPWTRIPP